MSKFYIDVTDYQERLARVPMEFRTYRKAVEIADGMPPVKAIPLEAVEQIYSKALRVKHRTMLIEELIDYIDKVIKEHDE